MRPRESGNHARTCRRRLCHDAAVALLRLPTPIFTAGKLWSLLAAPCERASPCCHNAATTLLSSPRTKSCELEAHAPPACQRLTDCIPFRMRRKRLKYLQKENREKNTQVRCALMLACPTSDRNNRIPDAPGPRDALAACSCKATAATTADAASLPASEGRAAAHGTSGRCCKRRSVAQSHAFFPLRVPPAVLHGRPLSGAQRPNVGEPGATIAKRPTSDSPPIPSRALWGLF